MKKDNATAARTGDDMYSDTVNQFGQAVVNIAGGADDGAAAARSQSPLAVEDAEFKKLAN